MLPHYVADLYSRIPNQGEVGGSAATRVTLKTNGWASRGRKAAHCTWSELAKPSFCGEYSMGGAYQGNVWARRMRAMVGD